MRVFAAFYDGYVGYSDYHAKLKNII